MHLGDFSRHVGRHIDGFNWGSWWLWHRSEEGRMLLVFCLEKELCVSWFKREEKRKVTFGMGENEPEIEFVLIKNELWRFMTNVKAIPGEFQHAINGSRYG